MSNENINKGNIEQASSEMRSVGLWKTRHFAQNLKIWANAVKPNLQTIYRHIN